MDSAGNTSSVSFVSCRTTASTPEVFSQSSNWGRRTFRELTFQLASVMLDKGHLFWMKMGKNGGPSAVWKKGPFRRRSVDGHAAVA